MCVAGSIYKNIQSNINSQNLKPIKRHQKQGG